MVEYNYHKRNNTMHLLIESVWLSVVPLISLCAVNEAFPTVDKEQYQGAILRVAAFDFPPVFNLKKLPQGGYEFGGVAPETVETYAKYLNMTVQYVITDPDEIARMGIIAALFRQMDEKEVDYALYFFELIPDNLKHMEISNPVAVYDYTLIQAWPHEESRLKVIARPFTLTVWACLGASTLLFIGVSSVFSYIQHKRNPTRNRPHRRTTVFYMLKQIEYVATIFTFQGNHVRYTATAMPFRFGVAVWLLPTMVILFAYCGVLTSMLTIPKFESIIDTLDQLVEDTNMRMTIEEDTYFAKQFLNASSGTYKAIGDMLRKDPKRLFFTDISKMLDNVINHDCVYPVNNDIIKYIIHMDYKSTGKCRIVPGSRTLSHFSVPVQFGNSIGSPFTKIIDNVLLRLANGGIRTAMIKKYLPPTDQCLLHNNIPKAGMKQLSLKDLFAAFVILGAGLTLSFITFLFELLANRFALDRNG